MSDFFNKLASNIDKGIKTVSSKGKEFVEVSKLKSDIRQAELSIQGKYAVIGKRVFEMFNQGSLNPEELKDQCAEITLLFKKISELEEAIKQEELKALKAVHGENAIKCDNCNAQNNSTDKFCNSCGAAIAGDGGVKGNVCSNCGASIKDGEKFCSKCGHKVQVD